MKFKYSSILCSLIAGGRHYYARELDEYRVEFLYVRVNISHLGHALTIRHRDFSLNIQFQLNHQPHIACRTLF